VVRSKHWGRVSIAVGDAGAGVRFLRKSLFCILGAALLTACAAQPYKAGSAMRPPKNPAHGVQDPVAVVTPPAATPQPATIWQSADKLMGLGADELQAALGKPARIRDEEDGRIFQYIGSDCVLDLFLYPEAPGPEANGPAATAGAFRVSYAEARSVRAEKKPVDTCLKSLPAPIVADNAPTS
jgi:hypothetical protein